VPIFSLFARAARPAVVNGAERHGKKTKKSAVAGEWWRRRLFFVLFAGRFFGANARHAEEPVAANSPLRRFVHTTEEN
jgi:hypothetical protein